jgi:hypothetical protein
MGTFAELVIRHCDHIRHTIPECDQATFVIGLEANMGGWAETVEDVMRQIDAQTRLNFDFFFIRDHARPARGGSNGNPNRAIIYTPGLHTNNSTKYQQVQQMTRLLHQGRIHYHERFSSAGVMEVENEEYQNLREAIPRQMGQFTRIVKPPPVGEEMARYATVKYQGREQDDFVMALLFIPWIIDRCKESANNRKQMIRPMY